MDSNTLPDFHKQIATAGQRARRKIAREVGRFYDAILRAAGFEPIERRTAWAISTRLYERGGEDCEGPRGISLGNIGVALTSKSDDEEACKRAAIRHVGHLFNHAIPRTGVQILTRYKAEEDSGKPHEYADHITPVAAFFSELLAEEIEKVLSDKTLDRKGRREKIQKLKAQSLDDAQAYLPKCEVELETPEGVNYVSAADAKAYCLKNPKVTARAYTYTPPAEDEKPKKPFYSQDLDRIEGKIRTEIEDYLEEIKKRNSFDEARIFSTRLNDTIRKALTSWAKVTAAEAEVRQDEEEEELIHGPDLSPPPADFDAENTPIEDQGGVTACHPPTLTT